MTLQLTLDFLAELAQNNNKAWFDANRDRYNQARSAFEDLIADLIEGLGAVEDLGALTPKECMFRINRDVRFSKDKSPYKSTMSAAIGRGGRNGDGRSYYFQIAPGDSFMGSGMFEPDKTALDHIRQKLARDARPLEKIVNAPDFVQHFGAMQGETLKTAPAGYDREHPAIQWLRYKQFLAVQRFTDADVVDDALPARFVAACVAIQPFLDYLHEASAPSE